jgi:hypothetical protein
MRRLLAGFILTCVLSAAPSWWMTEPIRWVQTNLRQTDASLDPGRLIDQLSDMRANVLLMGMGGIAAYYPTEAGYHYASTFLALGGDMFGDVLRAAHSHHIPIAVFRQHGVDREANLRSCCRYQLGAQGITALSRERWPGPSCKPKSA